MKCLGEFGSFAEKLRIRGAVATCVPFDPTACQRKLDVGFNRVAYSTNFLSTLIAKAEAKYAKFPGAFDIEAVRSSKTIGEFDDAFIARVFNFKDKNDYYLKSGSKWYLSKIRVPVVVINARRSLHRGSLSSNRRR